MKKPRIDGYVLAVVDLMTAMMIAFAALAVLAINSAAKAKHDGVRPGETIIEMRWDMARNADVDLWVKAPGDQAVGYSHMADAHCNSLRDDLGRYLDPQSRNEEMVVCRGIDPGEWIVDAMLYRTYDGQFPVKVEVTVRTGALLTTILDRTVELRGQGQQITLFRWRMDKAGHLIDGSVNHLQMSLYGPGGAQP